MPTDSYECKSAESKSIESQWSASRSKSINSVLGSVDSGDSVGLSKLELDSSSQKAFKVIGLNLTGAEIQSFRESFTSAKIRALKRASNADKLSHRRLEDQVKSLTEGIRRLKQTKQTQRMAEMEKTVAKTKETQRKTEKENQTLRETLAKKEEIHLAENRENEKAIQELNSELLAARNKILNLVKSSQKREKAASEALIKANEAFAERLEEKDQSWNQRLIRAEDEHKRVVSKNEKAAKLRLKEEVKEKKEMQKKLKELGNEKDALEYRVENCIFKSH